MSFPSVTYIFVNGASADANQVNQNFSDILNGISDGTKDLSINAITCAGTATFNGSVNLGNSSSDDLSITASLATSISIKTNNSYDFGGSTLGVRSVYFSSSTNNTTRMLFGSGVSNISWTLPGTNGVSGHVLANDGSGAWSYIPGQANINSVSSADYVILDGDGYSKILVSTGSSDRTVTLPAVATNSKRILTIVKTDSDTGKVIVDGSSSETIDGALTFSLFKQYESVTVACDGSTWFILGSALANTTYTPVHTTVSNISNTFVTDLMFFRVLNKVLVTGRVDITPTSSSTQTALGVSLPIPSNIAADSDLWGSASTNSANSTGIIIAADATNDRAEIRFTASITTNIAMGITFMYTIK